MYAGMLKITTKTDLFNETDRLLSNALHIDVASLPFSETLKSLNFDSIDFLDATAIVEKHYGVTFTKEELAFINSRRDFYNLLFDKLIIHNQISISLWQRIKYKLARFFAFHRRNAQ
jgi:acyl carrier protein